VKFSGAIRFKKYQKTFCLSPAPPPTDNHRPRHGIPLGAIVIPGTRHIHDAPSDLARPRIVCQNGSLDGSTPTAPSLFSGEGHSLPI
jgi:hypothetical protein